MSNGRLQVFVEGGAEMMVDGGGEGYGDTGSLHNTSQ
jgi:hypothetical protein